MDRVEWYRQVIVDVLNDYWHNVSKDGQKPRYEIIQDAANGHFLLLCHGWEGHRYVYQTIYHCDIIDGKVWVQYDATDKPIVQELLAAGVPKSDIVLAEYPVEVREHNGFALG